jgi:hypothetical protein
MEAEILNSVSDTAPAGRVRSRGRGLAALAASGARRGWKLSPPIKRERAAKWRNENAVKSLKTHDPAKSLIQCS